MKVGGEFQKLIVALTFFSGALTVTSGMPEGVPLPSVLAELLAQPAAESTASRSSTTLILTRGVLLRSRRGFQAQRSVESRANYVCNNLLFAFTIQLAT